MKFSVHRPVYDSVPESERTPQTGTPESTKKPSMSDSDSATSGFDSTVGIDGNANIGDPMARRGRIYARRLQRRLIQKDGTSNISLGHVTKRRKRFLGDIFTTMMDIKWRYVLIMFASGFVFSWLFFAVIWYIILVARGDDKKQDDPDWQPCMSNVHDFTTALLFSLETQHTIGYGYRAMEPRCPEAILVLMIQSCLGVFIQSLLTGFIFAKLSRPKGRASTIMFSRHAVINQRDGEYVLLFRVADMRKSHIVGANIRAVLVKNRITKEGELVPLCQTPLEVQAENAVDYYIFMSWPTTIIHKINEDSPLWGVAAEKLLSERFEIIVYLEGTVESTGMTAQVRTSYLPSEILWGHRLTPLVTYQKEDGQYRVDYTQFHNTLPVPDSMPECSACDFKEGNIGEPPKPLGNTQHLSFFTRIHDVPDMHGDDEIDHIPGFTIGPIKMDSNQREKEMGRRKSIAKASHKLNTPLKWPERGNDIKRSLSSAEMTEHGRFTAIRKDSVKQAENRT